MLSHEEYVKQGWCPETATYTIKHTKGKTTVNYWCMKHAGHDGKHHALSLAPEMRARYVDWRTGGTPELTPHHRERNF